MPCLEYVFFLSGTFCVPSRVACLGLLVLSWVALYALVVHLLVVLVLSWEEPKTWEVVPEDYVNN